MNIFLKISKKVKQIQKSKNDQFIFKKFLNKIRVWGTSEDHKTTLANINMFLKRRNNVINFFGDYGQIILESRKRVIKRKGLRIITPTQMFQRSPIALEQVKPWNTSENLLNEICQFIYSLYQAKEITKKVYNNIANSMKL